MAGACAGRPGRIRFLSAICAPALKRIDYIGVTFRTRSLDEIREINRIVRADLWSTVEAGKFFLPIYETYLLDDIAEALALMRSNQHFGKIVISIR